MTETEKPGLLSSLVAGLFGLLFMIYFVGAGIMGVYFNWQYAQQNGFWSWLFLGEVVATAKGVTWPYHVYNEYVHPPKDPFRLNFEMKVLQGYFDAAWNKPDVTSEEADLRRYLQEKVNETGQFPHGAFDGLVGQSIAFTTYSYALTRASLESFDAQRVVVTPELKRSLQVVSAFERPGNGQSAEIQADSMLRLVAARPATYDVGNGRHRPLTRDLLLELIETNRQRQENFEKIAAILKGFEKK